MTELAENLFFASPLGPCGPSWFDGLTTLSEVEGLLNMPIQNMFPAISVKDVNLC